ncbi:hypothetical protein [Actinospica robiniae]|uniref:hypothetical protein n=1 Tax=Actinospica robiniae TaxID=304901 RepID=UPI0004133B67|nr:hypothetical protein [Actinospica robiniae]
MSIFSRSGGGAGAGGAAGRIARRAAVPVIAAASVALAAGPALAAGTSVGISTTSAGVSVGQLTVSGAYQCQDAAPYAELEVSVSQDGPRGAIEANTRERVACTGSTLVWQSMLAPRQAGEWFSAHGTRVTVTLWTPGRWNERASSSIVLWPAA